MTRLIRLLALLVGLGSALPAQSNFHLFVFDELYSNADGTVQFVELRAISPGQQFLSGHELTSTGTAPPGGTRSFTFPNDLPGDTSDKSFLVATQGFAALGIVAPDYVVPNGFFAREGGILNFADAVIWQHGALPSDNRSINRDGVAQTPTPTNFAGRTGTIPASVGAALNFQGLWWSGEAESGWGLNIAHQGEIIFMTWFTYDTDGSSMWLVASDMRKTTGNTFTGTLRRTTGPVFSTTPYPASQVQQAVVGSATFTFTSADAGRFDYTVNNVTQSKNITRLVFDPARVPVCTSGGSGTPNLQDLWIPPDPAEQAWGVNVVHQGDILFATWFTYEANNRGQWYVMSNLARQSDGRYTGGIQRTTGPAFSAQPFNPSLVSRIDVGTATFNFNVSPATFSYTVGTVTQTRQIQRFVFQNPPTICR
jgi:hypothetical protein